jgi:hypothetical protein
LRSLRIDIDMTVDRNNPAWAMLGQDGTAMYLVRDTKGTKDFLKRLRQRDRQDLLRPG